MTDQLDPAAFGVIPHLVVDGAADAIDFYARAFGATELSRLPGPGGLIMHATIAINGAPVMLVDQNEQLGNLGPTALGGTPVTIHLNVADADAFAAAAADAGATVAMPVTQQFWGDRYGVLVDPYGHQWSVATPRPEGPMTPDEMQAAFAEFAAGQASA